MLTTHMPDKLSNFCIKAFKGLQVKVSLSPEQTYSMLESQFEGIDLPDAIDLLDEIGMFANQDLWIDYYDEFPFFRDLADAVYECGICDLEFGYASEQRTIAAKVKSGGIKELFDLVIAGCEEV